MGKGAGSAEDHYIQDAAESYIVYRLQQLAVSNGVAITDDVAEKQKTFEDYCKARSITEKFNADVYKLNIDNVIEKFFSDIAKMFSGLKFDIIDVEKEFRDKKLKGDFIIRFENGDYKSISLKNYKNGFNSIQLCSGTWNSFANNFLFEAAGVGMFIDPFTNERFKGSIRSKRNSIIEKMGYDALIPVYDFFDETNDKVKQFYVKSEAARYWKNISYNWKKDCEEYGLKASKMVVQALDNLPKETVKNRLVHMAGLNYDEELLLIGKGKYICSLTNKKYAEILNRVKNSSVKYEASGQSVIFTLYDDRGTIVTVNVPFTLQKNGAWHLPKVPYSGYQEKEGVKLEYGERRPKKSQEINTSINTYLYLKKAGVC
jgi:hypothetical protein